MRPRLAALEMDRKAPKQGLDAGSDGLAGADLKDTLASRGNWSTSRGNQSSGTAVIEGGPSLANTHKQPQ